LEHLVGRQLAPEREAVRRDELPLADEVGLDDHGVALADLAEDVAVLEVDDAQYGPLLLLGRLDPADLVARPRGGLEAERRRAVRAEVERLVLLGAADEEGARKRLVDADLDREVRLVVEEADVELRLVLLDQVVLEEERLAVRLRDDPVDVRDVADDVREVD